MYEQVINIPGSGNGTGSEQETNFWAAVNLAWSRNFFVRANPAAQNQIFVSARIDDKEQVNGLVGAIKALGPAPVSNSTAPPVNPPTA